MKNRFGSERERYGNFGTSGREERWGSERNDDDERSGWGRGRESESWASGEQRYGAGSREPQYSSDQDETYGSEWQRNNDRSRGGLDAARERGQSGYGQRESNERGWYGRGQAGMYGGGSGGGYQGGSGGGGYGGSTGTNYGSGSYGSGSYGSGSYGGGSYGGSQGSYGGGQGGYGGGQGGGYGTGSFGSSRDQGFRGRDFGSPGSDLRSSQGGGFAGRGPKGYTRTDDRIREDVCDRLSKDDDVDASEIEVRVQNGEVTLEGTVPTRSMKHRAENLADDVSGVKDVHNNVRVLKGLLNEIKDKVTGNEEQGHYANTGTKNSGSTQTTANGRA